MGLDFIGVVKQASHQYPMAHLQIKEFNQRVYCYGLVLLDEVVTEMMTCVWFYRYRRYLTRGSLEEGLAVLRQRWHQVVADVNSETHMVELDIPKPVAADIYNDTCSFIEHNKQ